MELISEMEYLELLSIFKDELSVYFTSDELYKVFKMEVYYKPSDNLSNPLPISKFVRARLLIVLETKTFLNLFNKKYVIGEVLFGFPPINFPENVNVRLDVNAEDIIKLFKLENTPRYLTNLRNAVEFAIERLRAELSDIGHSMPVEFYYPLYIPGSKFKEGKNVKKIY